MSILLTGSNGQVGGELLPMLQPLGQVVAPIRQELDLQDETAIREAVRRIQPRWIVNPAAYTAVDKAETDTAAAYALNEVAVRVLGEEAARCGAGLLHFSTDYVFDGVGSTPWREEDSTSPLGVYGASKLAGEEALWASGAAALVFRTSWVYGTRGKNFLKTILRAARERNELRIVDDQWGAPTWSRSLAHMTTHVIRHVEALAQEQGLTLPQALHPFAGVYHASDAGETTWCGFARELLGEARKREPAQAWAQCIPVTTEDYPTAAKRPANSRLNCAKVERTFDFHMPTWQESTASVVSELLTQGNPG